MANNIKFAVEHAPTPRCWSRRVSFQRASATAEIHERWCKGSFHLFFRRAALLIAQRRGSQSPKLGRSQRRNWFSSGTGNAGSCLRQSAVSWAIFSSQSSASTNASNKSDSSHDLLPGMEKYLV